MRMLVALALLAAGCFGTTYRPVPEPGRIQVTASALGSTTFTKDGKEIQSGFFSTALAEVMKDVPEARRHAETWRKHRILGLTLSIAASAITLVGVATIEPGAGLNARNTFSIASIVGGSFPLALTSFLFSLSADSELQDAVNLYNDRARKAKLGPGGLAIRW